MTGLLVMVTSVEETSNRAKKFKEQHVQRMSFEQFFGKRSGKKADTNSFRKKRTLL